jgi:hypothetical protein
MVFLLRVGRNKRTGSGPPAASGASLLLLLWLADVLLGPLVVLLPASPSARPASHVLTAKPYVPCLFCLLRFVFVFKMRAGARARLGGARVLGRAQPHRQHRPQHRLSRRPLRRLASWPQHHQQHRRACDDVAGVVGVVGGVGTADTVAPTGASSLPTVYVERY